MNVTIGIYKRSLLYWTLGLLFGLLLSMPVRADLDLAQTPLFLTPGVDPNIMFILDDSGSMQFETMPDGLTNLFDEGCCTDYIMWVYPRRAGLHGDGDYSNATRVPSFTSDSIMGRAYRSSLVNTLYYNPAITYRPWLNADGSQMANADPSAAPNRPLFPEHDTRNLTTNNTQSARWVDDRVDDHDSESRTFYPAVYSTYTGPAIADLSAAIADSNSALWDDINHYTLTEIKSANAPFTGEGRENRTDCAAAPSCTYNEEIQNFANWYSYHRNRIFASRFGIGKAFSTQTNSIRVGYGTINKGSTTIDGQATGTVIKGVRPFSGSSRNDFYDELYTNNIPPQGTPLRTALQGAGQYFSRTDSSGPWSTTPGQSGGEDLECRHSYTILMSDGNASGGSSNAASGARANNNDGSTANSTTNTNPDGPNFSYTPTDPFQDNLSNTLADVAMYYWKRDLRTDLDNLVPITPINEAFWQHMITFSVGLGVSGSIDPVTAFDAIASATAIDWGNPQYNDANCLGDNCIARQNDFLHAAVNSRGGYFSAAEPDTFATELSNTLNSIVARTEGSSASVATNSTRLDTNTVVYQAKFDSRDWTGQFLAFKINPNGSINPTPEWDAGQKVTTQGPVGRSIFSYNPSVPGGVEFFHGNLSSTQQSQLSALQVNYLRGNQSNEIQNGGTFRNRIGTNRLLGDLINSDPWFIGDINFGYSLLSDTEGEAYLTYRGSAAYKARTPLVAIGGNAGMLHVFNANIIGTNAGNEVFAYVPHTLFADNKLASLTDPNYNHQYFVDGSPIAGDAYFDVDNNGSKEWRNVLVGTLGAGGKGIFALDTTFLSPSDSTYETAEANFSANRVLWEINSTTTGFADLGFTLGQASIVRMANGEFAAVFGNGYNSANHRAVLYIVDIKTGALIKSFDTGVGSAANPNGLSTPIAIDVNGDRIVDAIYAGDLHGNLWKFDVSNSNPNNWDYGFKQGNTPKSLFVAKDAGGAVQPITAKPQAGLHPNGGTMIYFGTGKYFETGDNSVVNPQMQTFYGVRDSCVKAAGATGNCNNNPVSGRADLQQQEIIFEGVFGDFDVRVTSKNVTDLTNFLSTKQGWYMDLAFPLNSPAGERVVSQALLRAGRIIFVTLIPDDSPCGYGGDSWLMELEALTGNRLVLTPFDISGDGYINLDDMVTLLDTNEDGKIDGDDEALSASGKKSKVGIIKSPGVVGAGEVEYKYTSGSTGELETTLESVEGGSGRQSWRQLR
ncbi:pilus assembly protein [Methylotuvimicrobium sp. KM1]|uniref:pilus assembly protein n=1 Tax=Methylotuvimicrobium sp. KM1 TaxID=3377707 RepID=UPI00384EE6A8